MLKKQPPSPPPSTDEEIKYGITHWAHHNGHNPEYRQGYNQEYQPEFQLDYRPGYQPAYHSEEQPESLYAYRGQGSIPLLQERNMGSSVPGISLEEYGPSPHYQSVSGSEYPPIMPLPQPTFIRTSQLSNPPATAGEGGIRTRSGRSIPPPGSSPAIKTLDVDRVTKRTKSPRAKRPSRQTKTDKGHGITISAPLSELTKDLTHIPIKDMEAWVNRSADVRQKEVEKKNGKIARPMNSFMLYRSAYAERTKEWCAQNNHQVVSRASGQSWPLESKEVRDRFERYAAIERDNHQKAHPGYKFAPNKNQNPPKKKRPQEGEDEPSDFDDLDFDLNSSPRFTHKRARGSEPEDGYDSRHSTPFDQRSVDLYSHANQFHPSLSSRTSSWQATNPGRPLQEMMSPPEHTHYYQPSVHPSMMGHNVEDVRYQKMEVPTLHYDNTGLLTALPGGAHQDLLQPSSHSTPAPFEELQVDPELLAYDHGLPMEGSETYSNHLGDWQIPLGQNGNYSRSPLMMEEEQLQPQHPFHPGMQTLTDGRDPWQAHHEELQLDAGAEFDDWFSTTGY